MENSSDREGERVMTVIIALLATIVCLLALIVLLLLAPREIRRK